MSHRRDKRLRDAVCLTLIAGIGLALRLWGIAQGYPDFYGHVDEIGVVASIWNFFRAQTMLPTEFTYPALYSYLVALLLWISGWWVAGPQLGSHVDSMVLVSYLDPARAAIVGRGLSAVAGTVTVLFTFLIGARAHGRRVGIVAAAFMACAAVPVAQAHRALPDTTMAMLAAACFYLAWRIYESGSWGSYLGAGVAAGLVLATKYNGAFTALAIPAAHLLRSGNRNGPVGNGPGLAIRLFDRRLWSAVLAAIAAVFVGSPYLFLASEKYVGIATYQVSSLGFSLGRVYPWWWVAEGLVLSEWVIGGFMLVGVLIGLVRRRPFDWFMVAAWLPSFAYIGSWSRESLHYLLHLYPLLAVGAAAAAVELAERLQIRCVRTLLIGACLLPSLLLAVSYDRQLSRPDTRSLASTWIEDHVAAGTKIAMTWLPYCPRLALVSERHSIWMYYQDSSRVQQVLRESWVGRSAYRLVNLETWSKRPHVPEAYAGQFDLDDPETSRIFRRGWRSPEQLVAAGVEYVVLPGATYGRYLTGEGPPPGTAAAHYFQRNRTYFRSLTDSVTTQLVASFPSGSENRGGTIQIFRLPP